MRKRKKILFIVSRLPINLTSGDRARVYHLIKQLAGRGHRVDILGFVPTGDFAFKTDLKELCGKCVGVPMKNIEFENHSRIKQLAVFFKSLLKGYPFRVWQWHDNAFIKKAKQLIDERDYDVIHFSEVISGLVFDEVLKLNGRAKLVVDLIDSVAMSMESAMSSNLVLLPIRFIEKKRLKKYEQHLAGRADETVLISERDKSYLGLGNIKIIANGIDFIDYSTEQKRDIDLLFTGNMVAEPNIDAAVWFSKEVMPQLPHLKFYIVGTQPTQAVKALACKNIIVTGFVADINAYYQRAKIFVCPMRLGAGQKNKVLEAMMNQTPVISTAEANIGIEAPSDAIVMANNADEYVQNINRLMSDKEQRDKLAVRAHEYVVANFSWDKAGDALEKCYGITTFE